MKLEKTKLSANVKTVAQMRPDRRKVALPTFTAPDGRSHREDKITKGDLGEGRFTADEMRAARAKYRGYMEDSKSGNKRRAVMNEARRSISEPFQDLGKGKTSRERRNRGW